MVSPATTAPAVPVQTLLGKRGGEVDYFVPGAMERLLTDAAHFRVSECCAVLGIAAPDLVPILRLAVSRHLAGFQQRVAGFQSLVKETTFMNSVDSGALESLCFPSLQREMKRDREVVRQLNAAIGPVNRGVDLWVSRDLFFKTIVPATRVVYGTVVYGNWLAHVAAHAAGFPPPIVVA